MRRLADWIASPLLNPRPSNPATPTRQGHRRLTWKESLVGIVARERTRIPLPVAPHGPHTPNETTPAPSPLRTRRLGGPITPPSTIRHGMIPARGARSNQKSQAGSAEPVVLPLGTVSRGSRLSIRTVDRRWRSVNKGRGGLARSFRRGRVVKVSLSRTDGLRTRSRIIVGGRRFERTRPLRPHAGASLLSNAPRAARWLVFRAGSGFRPSPE